MSTEMTAEELAEARQLADAARDMAAVSPLNYFEALRLIAEAGEYVKARAEVERLRAQMVADARGFPLWLDRESWGIISDALMEHRGSAEARKSANSASTGDVRANICADLIQTIRAAASER